MKNGKETMQIILDSLPDNIINACGFTYEYDGIGKVELKFFYAKNSEITSEMHVLLNRELFDSVAKEKMFRPVYEGRSKELNSIYKMREDNLSETEQKLIDRIWYSIWYGKTFIQ